MNKNNLLWTDVFCRCGHHIDRHHTAIADIWGEDSHFYCDVRDPYDYHLCNPYAPISSLFKT